MSDEGHHGQMEKATTWIVTGHWMITRDGIHPIEGDLRSGGVIRLLFVVGPLYLINVWFGEDQKNKHHEDTCVKKIGLRLQFHLIINS